MYFGNRRPIFVVVVLDKDCGVGKGFAGLGTCRFSVGGIVVSTNSPPREKSAGVDDRRGVEYVEFGWHEAL